MLLETVSLNMVSSSHYAMIFVILLPIVNACKTRHLARISSDQSSLEKHCFISKKEKILKMRKEMAHRMLRKQNRDDPGFLLNEFL